MGVPEPWPATAAGTQEEVRRRPPAGTAGHSATTEEGRKKEAELGGHRRGARLEGEQSRGGRGRACTCLGCGSSVLCLSSSQAMWL